VRHVFRRTFLTAVGGILVAGCYTLQPVTGATPEVGARVAFDLTDAGRMALGGSMGPEIAQIEGRLVEKDNGGYLVSVTAVRLLRGGEQVWAGERVRLDRDYLGRTYERRFSPGRTIALSVVGIGGIAAFLLTRSLLASGTDDDDDRCPDVEDCEVQDRIGRP
jgi:hypothetical protein